MLNQFIGKVFSEEVVVTPAFAVGEQGLHNPVGVDDGGVKHISKKTFFTGRIEPASGRSQSALCLPSFRIS